MKTTTSQIRDSIHLQEVQDVLRTDDLFAIRISAGCRSSVERFVNLCRIGFRRFLSRQRDDGLRVLEPVPTTVAVAMADLSTSGFRRKPTVPQREAKWPAPAQLDAGRQPCDSQLGSLRRAITTLPVRYREALRIYYVDEVDDATVCAQVGIGRDEFRALREALRERFQD